MDGLLKISHLFFTLFIKKKLTFLLQSFHHTHGDKKNSVCKEDDEND